MLLSTGSTAVLETAVKAQSTLPTSTLLDASTMTVTTSTSLGRRFLVLFHGSW
jgi:hypothetical protein